MSSWEEVREGDPAGGRPRGFEDPGVQGHVLEGELVSGRPLAKSCIAITRPTVIRLMCEGR